jgi:phosphonate transport system substrate-binding protein
MNILLKCNSKVRFKLFVIFSVLIVVFFSISCKKNSQNIGPKYADTLPVNELRIYHFAIHALYNPVKMSQVYTPLIEYLNQNCKEAKFVLETSKDYSDFEKKYEGRYPEILLPNPWQTIQAMKDGYEVIAMAGDPKDFKGIFLVRADANIKNPIDLKGKKISYPSSTALAACIMPQYFLYKNGIDVKTDITNLYVGSQESSIRDVYLKISDVAATWPPPWRIFQKDCPKEAAELVLIWETESLLNNSVMVRNDLPENLKKEIQFNLIKLKDTEEGNLILQNMETEYFSIAQNKDYDIIRTYISEFEKNVRIVK